MIEPHPRLTMMSPVMRIPPEILETIMLFIDDDTESLSASSLVCSTWNAISQHLLFEHVHPLDLFRLLELNDLQMREFQPLFPRFRRLSLSRLAFVDATTAGKVEEHNVNARSFMFRALVRPEESIHYHRYIRFADSVLPWIPLSFQYISSVELNGPMEFDTYAILRDFLAGFANLEHLAFCFKFAKVKKESSLPSWTGLRLRSLQCSARLVDSGLVHALLSWLAASDSPRLTTLCVGLVESLIFPACYVRDPMKKLLETSKATLRTLEVHISSERSDTCENLRFSTWLIPDCGLETLHLCVNFSALCTVMDGAALPHLRHLEVTAETDLSDPNSAPSEDILTRLTLPSLDRVSVTVSYMDDGDDEVMLRPFASAKEREILEVTRKRSDIYWLCR